MPSPRLRCAHVVASGRMYVFGGLNTDTGSPYNSSLYYDPSINRWQEVAPMRYVAQDPLACAMNEYIFVLCDYPFRSSDRYDPADNSWTAVSYIARFCAANQHFSSQQHFLIYASRWVGSLLPFQDICTLLSAPMEVGYMLQVVVGLAEVLRNLRKSTLSPAKLLGYRILLRKGFFAI